MQNIIAHESIVGKSENKKSADKQRFFFASGYETDGFVFLIDGFELVKVSNDIAVCDGSDIVPAGQ